MNDNPPIERRADDPWRKKIEADLAANTQATAETKKKVDEVHEVLVSVKGALTVFGWIAAIAKWITIMLGAVAAAIGIYAAAKCTPVDVPIKVPKL